MSINSITVRAIASVILVVSMVIAFPIVGGASTITEEPIIVAATTTPVIIPVVKEVPKKVKKVPYTGDCKQYEEIIRKYDWPVDIAMQICRDESHGVATTVNNSDKHYNSKGVLICVSSRGLFQIACLWPRSLGYTMADLLIPEKNVAMAYEIWKTQGFYPWSTYKG